MKKTIILLLASVFAASLAFAHGSYSRGFRGDDDAQWNQMEKWHDVMHGITVQSNEVKNGIELQLTPENQEIKNSLKNDFKVNQESLSAYFKGTDVTLNETDKGFDIKMTSKDTETVRDLQYWRSRVFYQYLRDQMRRNAFGDSDDYGYMGGCNGRGHGGYGPGMMYDGWGRDEYGPGMMHGSYGHMGYGPMMDWDSDSESFESNSHRL